MTGNRAIDGAGADVGRSRRSASRIRRRWLALGVLVLLAAAGMLVRWLLLDIYFVRESSMWPGLRDGDRILVLKAPPDERFSVVVYREDMVFPAADGGTAVKEELRVKRLLGFPGEVVDFRGGDLFVGPDRHRLKRPARSPSWREAMLVRLLAPGPVRRHFDVEGGGVAPHGDGGLVLEAGSPDGLRATYVRTRFGGEAMVRDDRVDASGEPVGGAHAVPDVRLEVVLPGPPEGGRLVLTHALRGESRSLEVSGSFCRVLVDPPQGDVRELTSALLPGFPCALRMETLDGMFRVLAGRKGLADPGVIFEGPRDTLSLGGSSSVHLGLTSGRCILAQVDMHRDVFYFWPPALEEAHNVREQHVFLVGDNAAVSRDSREEDDVPAGDLVGRAVAVVWPPARLRVLP